MTTNLRVRVCLALGVLIALIAVSSVGVDSSAGATPAWSITVSPMPDGATQGQLRSVSCSSMTRCIAVGEYTKATDKSLIERWNGQSWAIMRARDPVGFSYADLFGVSCPSTTSCFAVGGDGKLSIGDEYTLIEHWDGRSWTIMSSPNPSQTSLYPEAQLNGVSCPTTTRCFAVGRAEANKIIEHWNGTTWTLMTDTTLVGSVLTDLAAVSCPGAKSCFAVGTRGPKNSGFSLPFVEHWNGNRWSLMNGTPSPGDYANLNAVSCPSTTSCFAAGDSQGPSNYGGFVERWGGRGAWSMLTSSEVIIGAGLSCPTTTSCVEVGPATAGTGQGGVEYWNAGSWGQTPSLTEPKLPLLNGVTCLNANVCFVVGSQPGNGHSTKTLVERYA